MGMAIVAIALGCSPEVRANPSGGTVIGGSASIGGAGNTVLVTQGSNQAIINWQDFSIGSGELTKFIQPSAASAILNRVISSNPSLLLGQLQANGKVFLINTNGVVVGQGATINAGGFAASTLDVSNASFMAGGDLQLSGQSPAAVVNLGSINASQGDIYLVAQQVQNAGSLTAANGTVGLAAGTEVTLTQNGSEHVRVTAPVTTGGSGAAVLNSGTINAAQAELAAAGGNLYALAINNTGVVRASNVQNVGGHIFLTADGPVSTSGTLDASASSANAAGGQVVVTGSSVNVQAGAVIAANGGTNGGTVLIGGDIHGGSVASENLSATPIATAQQTTVAQGARISANGGQGGGSGTGGSVVVWSDQQTNFQGSISALGGSLGGNGGFAEVSSHGVLNFAGPVDLLAPQGSAGTLLLDPANVTISTSATTGFDGFGADASNTYTPSSGSATSNILNTDLQIQLGSSNVTIVTTNNGTDGGNAGTITVNASSPVTWSSGTSLTLTAASSISINSSITQTGTGGGNITLTTGAGHSITIAGSTTVSTAGNNATVTLQSDGVSFGVGTAVQATGSNGEVYLQPVTGNNGIDIGFSNPGFYQLTAGELNDITATTLVIGSTGDTTTPLIVDSSSALDASSGDSLEHVTNLVLNGGSGGIDVAEPITLKSGGGLVLDTTGTFSVGSVGGRGGVFGITASGLDLLGTNESYNLAAATNAISTLSASVGSGTISLSNGATALEIGTVNGTSGVTAGTLNITDTGSVDNATGNGGAPISVTGLNLGGAGGSYTFTNSGNAVTNLSGSTGSVDLKDSSGLTITTVNSISGLAASGPGGIILNDSNASGITLASTNGALSSSGGEVDLKANAVALNDTITASNETVIIQPNTTTDSMGLGSGSGTLQVSQTELNEITAGTFQLGSSAQTGNLNVGGAPLTVPSTISNLTLETGGSGQISVPSGNSLVMENVGGSITFQTDTSPNIAGSVSTGSATAGTVYVAPVNVADTLALVGAASSSSATLQLPQATINNITAGTLEFGGSSATGAMSVSGNVTTPGTIASQLWLATAGQISVTTGNSVTDSNTNATLVLQSDTSPMITGTLSTGTSTNGTVAFGPLTASTSMGLVGAGGTSAAALQLTQAEINQVTAGTVEFGSSFATGSLTASGATTAPSTATNLTLQTAGQIMINSGATVADTNSGATLTLQSNLNPALGSGSVSVGTLGTVVVEPETASYEIDVGGTTAGLKLTSGTLSDITAPTLQIGGYNDSGTLLVDTNAKLDANATDSLQNITNLSLVGGAGGITINEPITMPSGGNLTLYSTVGATQGGAGVLTTQGSGGLLLLGSGANYNLSSVTSSVGLLAANVGGTGSIQFQNSAALSIGTVGTTNGVTANTLSLTETSTYDVTQTQPISANLLISNNGTGTGAFSLTNSSNAIPDLAGSTGGAISVTDSVPLTVTTVAGTSDLYSTGGAITLIDNMAGGSINLPVTVGEVAQLGGSSAPITLEADAITINAPVLSPTGTVTLQPFSPGIGIDIGGGTAGYLQLDPSQIGSNVTCMNLVIGSPSDTTNPILVNAPLDPNFNFGLNEPDALTGVSNSLTLNGGSGGIVLNQPISMRTGDGAGVLTLSTSGTVTQVSGASLTTDNEAGSGLLLTDGSGSSGTFLLNGETNFISTLAANVGSGTITLNQDAATSLVIGSLTPPGGSAVNGITAGTLGISFVKLASELGTPLATSLTQTQPVNATNLDLDVSSAEFGDSFTFDLSGATNNISTLAGSVGQGTAGNPSGTISLLNGATPLSIGVVGDTGVSGVTLTLNDTSTVSQTAPITANLELLGSGGVYTLNNPSNSASTLAANTGTVSLTDSSPLTIGTTGGTNNVTATGPVTLIDNSIALAATTGLINDSGQTTTLQPLTGGTAITLGGTAAGFNLPTAQLPYVTATTLIIGSDGTLGNASGAISVTAAINPSNVTNLALLSGSTVSQTGGSTVTATNLKVSGTTVTLSQANSVGTVAIKGSGNISFYNNPSPTVGSVLGLYGVTSSGGTVVVDTSHNLTLASGAGAAVSGVGSGDAVQVVDGGGTNTFTNSEGSGALSVTSGGGWWLVWSGSPLLDTLGSLNKGFKQYNATFGTTTPADLTDNGVLYTIAPEVTPGLTGVVEKQYDSTTAATLVAGNYTAASGAIDGDTVTLSTPSSGTYDTSAVGTGKTVTATGIAIVSASNGDPIPVYGYSLTSSSASGPIGIIDPAPLTISGLSATNKVYNQTTADTITGTPTLAGTVYAGDTVNLSGTVTAGTFASANVANGITVTATLTPLSLGGGQASDYAITGVTSPLSANITPAPLTISGLSATNKVYDQTTTDSITGTPTLAGTVYAGDTVNLSGTVTAGTFASANVANGITVTATLTPLSLGGGQASDYAIL